MTSTSLPVDARPPGLPATSSWRGLLRSPIAPETWRGLSALLLGWIWLLIPFSVLVTLVAVAVSLVVLWVGFPLLVATLWLGSLLSDVERRRLAAALDQEIDAPAYRAPMPGDGLHRRMFTVIGDRQRWREIGYLTATPLVAAVGSTLALALLGGGLALLPAPWIVQQDVSPVLLWLAVPGGIVSVYLGAVTAQAITRMTSQLAASLLGPNQTTTLTRRVEQLTTSRTEVVSAADAERRRFERDLHDGAQQRLVALSVELGMSARNSADDPAEAAAALDHAQREVKETLRELRDLVRGVHPAVLTDRGFDAALSALAARCPVPVTVRVSDAEAIAAIPPQIQTAAYFVAAEALTNLTRHSGATAATLTAQITGTVLHLRIYDDGRGGARAVPGGGLAGLRSRVEAADGTFRLSSPMGQGTSIEVDLPCAS